MLKPEHVERLRTLYSILPGIPEASFDITTWGRGLFEESECGTAACALGWAAVHPEFNACGLELDRDACGTAPKHAGFLGYSAGEKFFGITIQESEFLFSYCGGWHPYKMGSRYIACTSLPFRERPIEVMSRIREVLLHHGAITLERNDELAGQERILREGGLKALKRAGKLEPQA